MNDPAEAIKDKLVTDSVGAFGLGSGWRIFLGRFPDTPDTIILVNGTGGANPYPHLRLNFPSVQVMLRGEQNGYQEARAKAKEVCDKLLGMDTEVLNFDTYRSCNQIGDVIWLGQDENNRPIFSANFRFIVEPATGDNRIPIT